MGVGAVVTRCQGAGRQDAGEQRAGAPLSVVFQSLEDTADLVAAAGRSLGALQEVRAMWPGPERWRGCPAVADAIRTFLHRWSYRLDCLHRDLRSSAAADDKG
jgi:hypothetical protein